MPRLNFSIARKVLLYSVLTTIIFVSGYTLGVRGFRLETASFPSVEISRTTPKSRSDIDFALFWRVWDTLDSSYFDSSKIDPVKMVYGAISGMVAAVGDPYTAFLPPEENKVIEEDLSGSFEGVGIQIGFKGKQLAVIAPLPDTPADEAGVMAGDFIVGILDETKGVDTTTVGINISDAVKMIRGKAGTKVTLFLLRDGKPETIKVEIERKAIDVPSVIVTYVGENEDIAHIRLLKFGGETYSEWQTEIKQINKHEPKISKIVLDLRNNPGGYLQASVDIVGDFVKTGSVAVIEDKGGDRTNFKTERFGTLQDKSVVVLINPGSASASEILAGALRDLKRIKLVGETSFGKGTIQEPLQLEKGSSLHITTAKWLTPNGTWVNEKGITPDLEVKDDPETPEDEQLLEAIRQL
ncbi:S41 family peptidase [Candidatus Microgenomates bacterium]|nr:S41 family peptidase [Candidatus Microgenomates bacterium]